MLLSFFSSSHPSPFLSGTPAEGDAVKERLSALASLQAKSYAPAKLQAASMLDKESVRDWIKYTNLYSCL